MTILHGASLAGFSGLLLACSLSAGAQRTYEAGKIVFTDKGEYTQAQLEDAMGLHTGATFKQDDLNAAAQRLSDTGYFDSVGGSLEGMSDKVTVTIVLKPSAHSQLLHAGFENFIWLTADEITAAIRTKAPLYMGYLPETGTQMDLANDALKVALAAKGVRAVVGHETVEPTLSHPERVVEFVVVKPSIRVANVRLGGVKSELVPYVQTSVNSTTKSSYNEGRAGEQTSMRILAPLLDAGYAEASLTDVSIAPTAAAEDAMTVVVSATLNAGEVYRVGKITFAGTALMSTETFAATEKLHTGDVAARKSLIETLRPLDAAYRRQGYMDVVVDAAPAFDKTAHTVDYAVTAAPGEAYHVHTVQPQGLDDASKAEFASGFPMKEGDVFNPEVIFHYLTGKQGGSMLKGYYGGYKAYADPSTHTVDVVMTFYKGGLR